MSPLLALLLTVLPAGDWPAFLGPHGTGVSGETGLLDELPPGGPPVLWRKETGVGYAAPSVLGDAVILHHRVGGDEVVSRYDAATGDVVWEQRAATNFRDPFGYNGGPRATPLIVRGDDPDAGDARVVTLGAAGRLSCHALDTGASRWTRDLKAEFDIPPWFFGMGGSPVHLPTADGRPDRVAVMVGGQPDAGVVAFDLGTGKEAWRAVGKATWDGVETGDGPYRWTGEEQVVSYSTPTLATIHGEPHLLCLTRQGLVSLDPATGTERFAHWFRSPKRESVNAAKPVVVGDRVLICAAYDVGSELLRVRPDGRGVDVVWKRPDALACHWSTPIVTGGHAHGFSGRNEGQGELHRVRLSDGELVWTATGRETAGDVRFDRAARGFVDAAGDRVPWPDFGRGSLILADGRFWILGERGTLFLSRPDPAGYADLGRASVPGVDHPAWTAPVLADGRLFLRDEDTLVCLGVRADH